MEVLDSPDSGFSGQIAAEPAVILLSRVRQSKPLCDLMVTAPTWYIRANYDARDAAALDVLDSTMCHYFRSALCCLRCLPDVHSQEFRWGVSNLTKVGAHCHCGVVDVRFTGNLAKPRTFVRSR